MSVVDYNTGEYVDVQTGLLQKFGTDKGRSRRAGEYNTLLGGGQHMTEVVIDLVRLSALSPFASDINVILDDTVSIPNKAMIDRIRLTVMKASVGSSATLDFGLVDQDRSTEIDFNGFIAAGTTTWHTAAIGTILDYLPGVSLAGALVGTVLTNTGLLTAQVSGAAYTAGIIKLQTFWSVPLAADLA